MAEQHSQKRGTYIVAKLNYKSIDIPSDFHKISVRNKNTASGFCMDKLQVFVKIYSFGCHMMEQKEYFGELIKIILKRQYIHT